MPKDSLDLSKVSEIMKAGSMVNFNRNNIRDDNETIIKGQWDPVVHDLYRMGAAKVTGTTLEMTGQREDNPKVNCVNVIYEDGCATMGSVLAPGIIYSSSFSGCVFYLYRGPLGHIIGVHASRASKKLADPSGWFDKRGGTKIFEWDSLGVIKQGLFGSVVVCLGKTDLDVYVLQMNKEKIDSVIKHTNIKTWKTAPKIDITLD